MAEELVRQLRTCIDENTPCENAGCGYKPFGNEDCIDQLMRRAADAIEELSKQNEKWEEVVKTVLDFIPCWIPVTERLPDGIALAVNAMQGSYGYREYLIGYIGKNEASDSGYSCESDGEILMNVTHWMPLPEPPKEVLSGTKE